MADYYPLLARALDALPDRSSAMRQAVYMRARNALIGQLRSLEPPLAEGDIELERKALDKAIERLEAGYAEPPAPQPASPPEPVPPANDPYGGLTDPMPEPALPPAPAPSFIAPPASRPPEPPPPREATVPITARKVKPPDPIPVASPEPVQRADPFPDLVAGTDGGNGHRRPRIDVVAPRGGRSRLLRNAIVGVVLTVVIGLIAVAAFLLRDRPANLQPGNAETVAKQQPDGTEAKYADRVGGSEPATKERAPPMTNGAAPAEPRTPAAPPMQSEVAVAQRAALIEENLSAQNAPPTTRPGRVVWRLESVSGEQGQPLETAVVATVSFPDAGLSLVMTIQRNLDATLPASHTINLAFAGTGSEGERRSVQDVGLLQAKDEESGRGSPVSGLPVRVRENLFLIGLSSLKNDVDRNTDMLLHKPWLDVAVRYANGQRAVLTFEKGTSGTQAMQNAFDQWR